MRTRRSTSSSDPVPPLKKSEHQSVLLHEALELLAVEPQHTVVDMTVGGAGHTKALASLLGSQGVIVGLDLDEDAIQRARTALTKVKPQVRLAIENFKNVQDTLPKLGITHVDRALFDLGWSAYQLKDGRGFSFKSDEPLLMTYSKNPERHAFTASQIVNTWDEEHIADIIFGWGEERFARRIAKAIVAHRSIKPFKTAHELSELIAGAVPSWYRYGKTHPATKTFQALRMAVNDELNAVREGLSGVSTLMCPKGRVAVITFHSLEDRIVKRLFQEWNKSGRGVILTKKPVAPHARELADNPRARSAKLRVFEFA